MLAMVTSVEEVRVDNTILLDYWTSEVALEEPDIRSTDQNIQIDNNCTNDKLHFRMLGGSGNFEDDGEDIDKLDTIPTASEQQRAPTALESLDRGTSDIDWYEGEDDDDADADEEDQASQANDESMQNVEH
jgi:hypothetical protein